MISEDEVMRRLNVLLIDNLTSSEPVRELVKDLRSRPLRGPWSQAHNLKTVRAELCFSMHLEMSRQ